MRIFDQVYWGNRVFDYIKAAVVLFGGILFVKVIITAIVFRLKKLARKTTKTFDNLVVSVLEKIALPALYLSCLYTAFKILNIPQTVDKALNVIELAVVTFFATRFIIMFLSYLLRVYVSRKQQDVTLVRSLEGMLKVGKFLVWVLAVVIFLDNIGFKVSTLLAGLGIGGVAVAIAAQALLEDFLVIFPLYSTGRSG